MAQLTPVDGNPFESAAPAGLTAVEGNPFEESFTDKAIGLVKQGKYFKTAEPPEGQPKPRTVFELPEALKGTSIDAAIGLLTIPATGLYTFGSMLYSSVAAFGKTVRNIPEFANKLESAGADPATVEKHKRNVNLSFGETFSAEYFNQLENAHKLYVPLTETSRVINDAIGQIFTSGVNALGEHGFQTGEIIPTPFGVARRLAKDAGILNQPAANSAVAGTTSSAIANAMLLLAPLMKGPKAAAGEIPSKPAPSLTPAQETIQAFAKKYPETDLKMQASNVGKIRREPGQSIFSAIDDAFNKELSLPPEVLSKLSVEQKLNAVIDKYGPNTPVAERQALTNAYISQFAELTAMEQAAVGNRLALPAPKQPDVFANPIIVTPKGTAITPEQGVMMNRIYTDMDAASRADALGISPAGRMRIKMEEATAIKETDPVAHTAAIKDLEKVFNKNFDFPKNSAARKEAWQEFQNRNGQMNWDEISSIVGPRSQRGALDLSGLDKLFTDMSDVMARGLPLYAVTGPRPTLRNEFILMVKTASQATQSRQGLLDRAPNKEKSYWSIYDASPTTTESVARLITEHDNQLGITTKLYDIFKEGAGEIQPGIGERVVASLIASNKGYPIEIKSMTSDAWPFWEKLGVVMTKESNLSPIIKGDGILTPEAYLRARSATLIGAKPEVSPSQMRGAAKAVNALQGEIKQAEARLARGYVTGELKAGIKTKLAGLREELATQKELFAGPGKGQRGAIEIEGIDLAGDSIKKNLGAAGTSAWRVTSEADAVKQVESIFNASVEASEAGRKISAKDMLKRTRRAVVAHDYDLRHELENAGAYGEHAVNRLIVQNGATMAAKTKMNKINAGIFDGLSKEGKSTLDQIVRARRIIQIDKYKGVGVVRHEGGVTGPAAETFLSSLEKKLGSDIYNQGLKQADAIFTEHLKLLSELKEAGLIDNTLYNKLKNFDYQRTEYLDAIDPAIPITSKLKDLPQSVRSSGIPLLGRGKKALVEMDSQALLAEDVARIENRISKNATLQALYTLAEKSPENSAVRIPAKSFIKADKNGNDVIKSVPDGWTALGVRVEGKQKNVLMRDDLAEQFISRPEPMPEWVATVFRYGSGSQILKMSATAYNPTFVVAGLPMDILHTWMATANVYSPQLPKFMFQMGKDLAITSKDAITRTGAYEQSMLEGLGSSFLTHESRGLTGQLGLQKNVSRRMLPKWENVKNTLSYFNETADIWVRLAHRDRLIKQGMSSWEATAAARDRLDFYQGGFVTRAVDTIVPYTNVAVQSFAKVAKNANRDPAEFAVKLAWLTGTLGSAVMANMIASPETWKGISTRDKVRNLNITLGDQFYVLDPEGNKRYIYIPLRLDSTATPVNAALIGGLELAEYGKTPDSLLLNTVEQFSPLVGIDLVPSIAALNAYASNFDSFNGRPIYSGPKVKPEDEVRTAGQGRPTNQLAVAAGQVTGMSPARLEAATGKLLNTNNFWLQSMGAANRLMFQGMNPREQAESTMQMLTHTPLGSIIKLTSPLTTVMPELEKLEQAEGSRRSKATSSLDDLIFKAEHKQDNVNTKTIETYINSQPMEDRQRLADHYKINTNVARVMKHYSASDGVPAKTWWIATAKANPVVRAQAFHGEWLSADAEGRQRMMRIAGTLQRAGVGYTSDEFMRNFKKEQQLLGSDQR